MSREIKFRAWDKKNGYYADYEDIEEEVTAQAIDGWRSEDGGTSFTLDYGVKDFVVEQYTGLKDKNGKEIYEGDIMEFGIAGDENRGVVGYEEDFGSYETYTSKGYIIAPLFTSRGKVIGNIHENPELLGGEK